MKEYLLLFRNASNPEGYVATTQDMAEDMSKWEAWIGNIAMQGKLVHTAPIAFNGRMVTVQGTTEGPYRQQDMVLVSGFLICKSDSIEEVERWSANCPIHKYPSSSVEIRPLLPFLTN